MDVQVPPYRALVVGLGRIGFGLDAAKTDGSVLTHARAYSVHPRFELVAGVDPDPVVREAFSRAYRVPAFARLDEVPVQYRADIISLATPTETHAENLAKISRWLPRAVILEKPLGASLEEAEIILRITRGLQIPVLVNYVRRFEPGVLAMQSLLEKGGLGKIFKGVVWYTKGLLHNGSHFVDLVQFLFRSTKSIRYQLINSALDRMTGHDAEPDFILWLDDLPIYFLSAREESFSHREMEVYGTQGVLRYTQAGARIRFYPVENSKLFAGYRFLAEQGEDLPADLSRYQYYVVDALAKNLDGGAAVASTPESAMASMKIVESILAECRMPQRKENFDLCSKNFLN